MQKVRALQDTIEKRRTEDFMNYIEGNLITNCDIMRKHSFQAEEIFGPNLRTLKGKNTRHPTKHVRILWPCT